MAVDREDLDRSRVVLSDVTTGCRLPPVHPGEILRGEFLKPLGAQRVSPRLGTQGLAPPFERYRPRPPRRHDGHRIAPRPLLRDDAGVLAPSSDPVQSGCRRTVSARHDRAGDHVARPNIAKEKCAQTETGDLKLFNIGRTPSSSSHSFCQVLSTFSKSSHSSQ